jgi:uncharacterized membrane protein YccC
VGLVTNQRAIAIFVAIGALWCVSQDGVDRWRARGVRLASVALCGGVGTCLGVLELHFVGGTWQLWTFLGVAALVAGLIETSFLAAPGMYFLLGAILGSGLQTTTYTVQPGLYVAGGGLLVTLVAMMTDHRSRQHDQRLCLADAYGALATFMTAIGQSLAGDVRPQAVFALDVAQSALSTASSAQATADPEAVALRDCFLVALQIGELSAVMNRRRIKPDPAFCAALNEVAGTLRRSSAISAREQLHQIATRVPSQEHTPQSAQYAKALQPTFQTSIEIPPVPPSTLEPLPGADRLRFAALLAAATVAAAALTHFIDVSHAFWLPLSVAFILRPDLGPVIPRATARTAGTLAGVGLAALVTTLGNSPVSLVVLCVVLAAIVPLTSRRSHALTVFIFTPIVFVFLSVLGPDQTLFFPRIIDTVLAAGIVLAIDGVLWTRAPSLRPAQQLARAEKFVARYETSTDIVSPESRHQLRRNALRATSHARAGLRQAQREPHPLRRGDSTLMERIDELELRIDERTAFIAGFAT